MPIRISVPKETTPGERRVALVPEVVKKLTQSGWEIRIEPGAGASAGFPDAEYGAAGARIEADPAQLWGSAAVVLKIAIPSEPEIARLPAGAIVVSLMNAHRNLEKVRALRSRPVTA
ncbi:NAD(P)(+) transhydrogenase (AB-specific), partial [mine drainage metagenome]